MAETNIDFTDEEELRTIRHLQSNKESKDITPTERRLKEEYKDVEVTDCWNLALLLLTCLFVCPAIFIISMYTFYYKEPTAIPALISYGAIGGSFTALGCAAKNHGQEHDRITGEMGIIMRTREGEETGSLKILIDDEAPSIPTTSRALGKTRTVGQVNHSFVESSLYIENEKASLLPSSAKLIAPQINNPINSIAF